MPKESASGSGTTTSRRLIASGLRLSNTTTKGATSADEVSPFLERVSQGKASASMHTTSMALAAPKGLYFAQVVTRSLTSLQARVAVRSVIEALGADLPGSSEKR